MKPLAKNKLAAIGKIESTKRIFKSFNRFKLLLFWVLAVGLSHGLFAQNYPFDLPENMTATLNVNTTEEEPFNNLLLGVNIHDLAHVEGQELVRDFNPITIRFPHGLFANWYDWEKDKARVYGTDQFTYTKPDGNPRTVEISYLDAIKTMDRANLIVGIEGLTKLNNEKKATTGKGYDMMWTFNMSADGTDFNNGSPVSVARYNDLISRGLEVKVIEMGNENFYAGQRSSIIPNPSDYIARARSMYKALKELDPNLKISVPLERKSKPANTGWNTTLTENGTDYFDAVTVHTYVGYDPDDPANGEEAYSTALTAREVLRKTIDDYSKVVAPDKPIWLTEWGVKSGGPNAVSAMGAADCYMFMSENQDTYERANWFSVNGKLNSHLVWHNVNGKLVKKVPYEKTSYGSTYEIVRSVYENSIMLGSEMTVPTLDGVVNAVNARAVKKDGETIVFAVNLSDQEVPFIINLDSMRYYGELEHKAFAFSSMTDEISIPYFEDPLTLVKEGRGNIFLPKFSINTIVLKDSIIDVQSEVDTTFKVSFNLGNEIVDILTEGFPALIPTLPEEPIQADSIFQKWITANGERFDTNYLVFEDLEVFPVWQVKRFPINVVSAHGHIEFEPKQTDYEIHSEVTLTAIPSTKYEFVNWTGDYESNDTTITVVMDSTINLVANYKSLPYYRLDVYASKGEVTKFPNSSRYISGFTVELTANPSSGYEFESWSGDYEGTENPLYLTMKEDMEIFANFVPKTTGLESVEQSSIKVYPNPNNGVFIIQLEDYSKATYKVYSITGVLIQSGRIENHDKLIVKEKKSGVYLLTITTKEKRWIKKVIVN